MNHIMNHMNHKRFTKRPGARSITIHGIEPELYRKLEVRARKGRASLNRTLKDILEESLGANTRAKLNPFADLSGTLASKDTADLLEREKDFERIDKEDWS